MKATRRVAHQVYFSSMEIMINQNFTYNGYLIVYIGNSSKPKQTHPNLNRRFGT